MQRIRIHEAMKLLLLLCFAACGLCQVCLDSTHEAQFDTSVVEIIFKVSLSAQADAANRHSKEILRIIIQN